MEFSNFTSRCFEEKRGLHGGCGFADTHVVKIGEVIVNFFEVCMFCRSKKNETITPFFLIISYYSRSHMRDWMITAWMTRTEWLRSSTWKHQFWNSNVEKDGRMNPLSQHQGRVLICTHVHVQNLYFIEKNLSVMNQQWMEMYQIHKVRLHYWIQ